ncbi:MAG: hypothetical protein WBX15_01305 [Thermoanaerobaculia bacterium]
MPDPFSFFDVPFLATSAAVLGAVLGLATISLRRRSRPEPLRGSAPPPPLPAPDDHTFISPRLGVTMADGGERWPRVIAGGRLYEDEPMDEPPDE